MNERKPYSSDLTDDQWQLVEPLVPAPREGGRPPKYARREIVNAVLYLTRNGCAWRNLPHDLPPWSLVHNYFWHWKRDGIWQSLHDRLREQVRQSVGRAPQPSAAVLDSQSVKTTEKGGSGATTAARRSTAASATSS
jgi:transposase